jgi:adenylate cyclase
MNSALKSKRLLKLISIVTAGFLATGSLILLALGTVWTEYDFKVLDLFYRKAVKYGLGARQSPLIVILAITDETYDHFGKNILDRGDLAAVNEVLARLGVEALAYDLIFARPSNRDSDERFTKSIREAKSVYLPVGLEYSERSALFRWEQGRSYERFRSDYLRKPLESGNGTPYHATRALMQDDRFAEAAFNSGHISAYSDPDGIYRHVITMLKVEDAYFSTLSLAVFLDYVRVPFEKILVEWGRRIIIPAAKGSLLEKEVSIPIDDRGRAYIPYPSKWEHAFKKMEVSALLKHYEDESLRGNLREFFEGKFVLIGDISVGSADLGHTPLESDVPLILLHAAMLNAMLTNTFYTEWPPGTVVMLIWVLSILLSLSAMVRSSWILYGTGLVLGVAVVVLTWFEFIHFSLLPVVTVGGSILIVFLGLVATLEIAVGKERSFIKNAFSRYVPGRVVETLLSNPELLKLGGEERVITVLFSDLVGFTSIAEGMSPPRLVQLLNEYLTEMTEVVLAQGGIIDKYEGDAIMAEFGAPLPLSDHADRAVRAGLKMQKRLKELRTIWAGKALPELECRVGINTGSMIIGNMGSNQVFDYTVIGDAVNLASRLESANKRYNTCLIVSESTHQSLTAGLFRTRVLDVIKVKGKSKAAKVFEVYGEQSESVAEIVERYYESYRQAFARYLCRDFEAARNGFQEALSLRPDDPAAMQLIERMNGLDPKVLPADWDGSIALATK